MNVLLALDAGVRETGWAIFTDGEVIESGVTGLSTRRKVEPEVRVSHLIESLDQLADQWTPQAVALCQPSGINWPVPALDLLVSSLTKWSSGRGLPQFSYTGPSGQNSHRRAPQRVPRPTGIRHHAAIGAHRPGTLHPRVGSHRRRPLPPDSSLSGLDTKSPLPSFRGRRRGLG